jgi:futalosine hydrolase
VRILIVAATSPEVDPIAAGLRRVADRGPRLEGYAHGVHAVDILTTGIGMVATAAWCSRVLALAPYDLALNLGVCGSFDPALDPGCVVHVVSDRIAELGAEDGEVFLAIEQLGLPGEYECLNQAPPANAALAMLPRVRGITVNTVHGNEGSIAETVRRFSPQVESMEGAAFMYACGIAGVAHAQVRAVSNVVERRNRAAWKLSEAVESLRRTAQDVLADL